MLCLHELAHLLEALLDSLEILLESIQVAFGGLEEVDDLCHVLVHVHCGRLVRTNAVAGSSCL